MNKFYAILNLSDERTIDDFLYKIIKDDEYVGEEISDLYEFIRKELRDIIDPSIKPLPSFNELCQILRDRLN